MGLDMNLYGEKFLMGDWNHPEKDRFEDGFKVDRITLDLGYWRKHPNLHGFIVQTFANGEDECQRINLTLENLKQIVAATMNKALPTTTGFFFGVSQPEDDEQTIAIMMGAIQWLEKNEPNVIKSIYYQASW